MNSLFLLQIQLSSSIDKACEYQAYAKLLSLLIVNIIFANSTFRCRLAFNNGIR